MKRVCNSSVAEAWALGIKAKNHRGSFWTDGKKIYSSVPADRDDISVIKKTKVVRIGVDG